MDGSKWIFNLSQALQVIKWLKDELRDQCCIHCMRTFAEHTGADHFFNTKDEGEIAN